MKTPTLETERLVLRPLRAADIQPIFNCWMQDEDVSRYMWWHASSDVANTQEFVDFELSQLEKPRWKRWIIETKDCFEIAGTCLVFFNEDEKHWDISYNLGKKFWGRGFATEAMRAALQFAETAMGVDEFVTSYAKVNLSSAKVLKKLGFVDVKEIPFECNGGLVKTEGVLCRRMSN